MGAEHVGQRMASCPPPRLHRHPGSGAAACLQALLLDPVGQDLDHLGLVGMHAKAAGLRVGGVNRHHCVASSQRLLGVRHLLGQTCAWEKC